MRSLRVSGRLYTSLFIVTLFFSQTRFPFSPGSLLNSYSLLPQTSAHCFGSFLRDIYCCNSRRKVLCYIFPNNFFQLDLVKKNKVTDCAQCLSVPRFLSMLKMNINFISKSIHLTKIILLFCLLSG